MKKGKFITKTIIIVSVVSLLTDVASEMLYPVMPLYLQSIGYGILAIGLIEGFSEVIAGINKVFFARLSDISGRRKLFITIGYSVSAIAKPAIGLTNSIWTIFSAKFLDRLGKGVRTAPRDALLVSESLPENRGKVFGFHRSLDTLGAIIGPLFGLLILILYPGKYKLVFLVSIVPGLLAVGATFLLPKDKPKAKTESQDSSPLETDNTKIGNTKTNNGKTMPTVKGLLAFWKGSSASYKKLLIGFTLFSLVNSSNMFLLIRSSELGFSDVMILVTYLVFNIVSAPLSYLLGAYADKKGFKKTYILGLLAFAIVYAILGYGLNSNVLLILIFALYGVFGAVEDGIAKAWLSLHVPSEYKATGLGLFMMCSSFGFLFASAITALLWQKFGSSIVLSMISVATLLVIYYFFTIREPNKQNNLVS
ncbi:MAG: MFS transporter [Candidatus Pacebacteria bacterium]|nr:MFS transporter [Candidatus Paceibacterota bacterium]